MSSYKYDYELENNNSIENLKPLTLKDRTILFLLINVSEATIGFLFGIVLNVTLFKWFPVSVTENLYDSLLKMLISISFVTMIMLFSREFVETLPMISQYKKRPGFYHPPPIALAFALFRTIDPIKYRAHRITTVLKRKFSVEASPWINLDENVIKILQNKSQISLYILIVILILVLLNRQVMQLFRYIHNYIKKRREKLHQNHPDKYLYN